MKRILTIIFISFFISNLAYAQAEINISSELSSFFKLVWQNNTSLKQQELTFKKSGFGVQVQNGVFDPELSVQSTNTKTSKNSWTNSVELSKKIGTGGSFSLSLNNTKDFSPDLFSTDIGVNFTQPLLKSFGPENAFYALTNSQIDQLIAKENYNDEVNQIILSSFDILGQYFLAVQKQAMYQKKVDFAHFIWAENENKLKLNLVSKLDLVSAKIEYQNALSDYESAKNDLKIIEHDLLVLLAQDQLPDIKITEDVFKIDYEPSTLPSANWLEKNANYIVAENNLKKATLALNYYQNQALPDLKFLATLDFSGSNSNLANSVSFSSPNYTLGFSLGLPIGNNQNEGQMKNKEMDFFIAKLNYDNTKANLLNEFYKAGLELEFKNNRIPNAKLTYELAKEKLDLSKKKFELGLITTDIIITAEEDLETAEINYYQYQIDYLKAVLNMVSLNNNLVLKLNLM
jgi:outer membrane protein TolC